MRKLQTLLALFAALMFNFGQVWASDSGLAASDGVFIIDFYDSEKLTSTSGTGLSSNNYSNFVKVATGLTKANVVTGVSVTGTVQYGKNGGLTAGTGTAAGADSHYVTFSIGSDYAVNKVTVYATQYESGRWKLNGNVADDGQLGAKGATFSNVTEPLVWDGLNGATSLTFKKDNGSNGNQKRLTIYTIVCEYGTSSSVEKPTITPSETSFNTSANISITCETDGASIFYTTDNDAELNEFVAFSAFSITDTTTVRAYAVLGTDTSAVATKTFKKYGPFTCADVYTRADDAFIGLDNVTVTYVNSRSVYVKDNAGAMLLYLPANATWEAGDVLAGVEGTIDIYNGLYEIKPNADQVTAVTATEGDAPAPSQLIAAPTSADINKYVVFNNVLVSTATFTTSSANTTTTFTIGGQSVTLQNYFKQEFSFVSGTHYNVTGVVNYNSSADPALRVYFVSAEEKVCDEKVTITKGDDSEHGSFTLNNSGQVCVEYEDASTIVTATPDEHWHVASVTSTVGVVGSVVDNQCTITGIDNNTTINVTFAEDDQYAVTWNTNGATSSSEVYEGEKPVFPATPTSFDATSNTFYGWATAAWEGVAEELSSDKLEDITIYTSAAAMPNVTAAITYYAVFAKATAASSPTSFTSTFNSASWEDANSLWTSGTAGSQMQADRGIQIQTGASGANATTKSSYKEVTSVVVTCSTNKTSGEGTIAIEVGETGMGSAQDASYSGSGDGREDKELTFSPTPPATSLTGSIKITATCSTNSIYVKSVQVYYSQDINEYSKFVTTESEPTALDNTDAEVKAVKVLRDGVLYIEKDGKTYNILGTVVK